VGREKKTEGGGDIICEKEGPKFGAGGENAARCDSENEKGRGKKGCHRPGGANDSSQKVTQRKREKGETTKLGRSGGERRPNQGGIHLYRLGGGGGNRAEIAGVGKKRKFVLLKIENRGERLKTSLVEKKPPT